MTFEATTTALGFAGSLVQNSNLLAFAGETANITPGSLIEFSKTTRVEPIVLVDQKIIHLPYMQDVQQSLVSIFAAYYLQAVALSVNVGKVNTLKLLDRINPNRSLSLAIEDHKETTMKTESYKYQLPMPGQSVGLEAYGIDVGLEDSGNSTSSVNVIKEATNLSVGKLIEVNIESEGQHASFPVNIRLLTNGIASETLVHMLSTGSKDISFGGRWHEWRSGQIEFIRDLVLCQDLIDEYRNAMIKDKKNIYADMAKRKNNNRISTLLSGKSSLATASNIVVMSDSTRKDIERTIGSKISDFKTRERIFAQTYLMLMVVVEPEWEQVTIYHRSLDTATELSAKDMKNVNRGNGPDITDILKAYQLGNAPSM